MAQTYRRRI